MILQFTSIVIVEVSSSAVLPVAHGSCMYVSQCLGRSSMDTTNLKSFGNSLALCGYIRRYDCLMVLSATPTTSPTSKNSTNIFDASTVSQILLYLFGFFSDQRLVMPCILQLLPQINTLACYKKRTWKML